MIMKNMLLTATVFGTVLAAFVLYAERKRRSSNRIKDAAEDAYDTMNEGIGKLERPAYHAMG